MPPPLFRCDLNVMSCVYLTTVKVTTGDKVATGGKVTTGNEVATGGKVTNVGVVRHKTLNPASYDRRHANNGQSDRPVILEYWQTKRYTYREVFSIKAMAPWKRKHYLSS